MSRQWFIAAMNSGTNTVARVAAPVTHIAEGATSKNTKSYRYEHATPARAILALMFKSYVQGDKSIDMHALKADYKVAIIPLAMDKVVTACRLCCSSGYWICSPDKPLGIKDITTYLL